MSKAEIRLSGTAFVMENYNIIEEVALIKQKVHAKKKKKKKEVMI